MAGRLRAAQTAELASYGAILIAVSQITGWPWVYLAPESIRSGVGDPGGGLLLFACAGAVLLLITEVSGRAIGKLHALFNQVIIAMAIIIAVALVFVGV